jgi:hypothetical protein
VLAKSFAMPRRKSLTDKMLAAKPRRAKRYIEADPELRGHYVRISPAGLISFVVVARGPLGQQMKTVGTSADLTIGQARERAREMIRRIKDGLAPVEPGKPAPLSVADIAADWLHRHVEKNKLRTAGEIRRVIDRYALPVWRDLPFAEIRRSDIARLLDNIEDKHGRTQADAVLSVLRNIANWHRLRDDNYVGCSSAA